MAPVPPVAAMADRDRALVIRIGHDLELGAEAPDQEALEAGLLRVAQLGVAGGQLAARGVDAVDQVEQLDRTDLDAAGEHGVRIEPGSVVTTLGHGVRRA